MPPMRGPVESDARNFSPGMIPRLGEAARDLRYLLERRYGLKASLKLVGDRFRLTARQRHFLYRAVSPPSLAAERRAKRIDLPKVRGRPLAVDGYNVLITTEAALAGAPLVASDDGFLRDIVGAFASYRRNEHTGPALDLLVDILREAGPSRVAIYLDEAMSRSGLLAEEIRERLAAAGIPGTAWTSRAPDHEIRVSETIAATSDSALIDRVQAALDLPGEICRTRVANAWIIEIP